MPSFKKAKYTIERTQEIMMRALGVVCDSSTPLTIADIQKNDLILVDVTSQKIARVLNELVERGIVVKTKSKSHGGRMVYMSVETLESQGYNKETFVC